MKVFKSKIDLWLLITLGLSSVVSLVAAYSAVRQPGTANILIAMVILLVGAGLPVWLFSQTKYIVAQETLRVRCGPFSWSIPVSEISSVTATRNPLSSPALSLDRLALDYGKGKTILVSPSDKSGFRAAIGHPEQ